MSIKKELRLKGIRDNQFGLVGFGGEGVHNKPHTHTIKGRFFDSAEALRLVTLEENAGTYNDVRRAVQYAAIYPFRTGVSKNIVLVPCSACESSGMSHARLAKFLHDRDITLHVMQPESFSLRINTPKASSIIGMDDNTAFTLRDALSSNMLGNRDLFEQIDISPKSCAKLALQSQGSAFNTLKMTGSRDDKHFLSVFARRVADSARPTERQICKCTTDANGHAQTVCKAASLPLTQLQYNTQHLLGRRGENPTMEGYVRPLQQPQQVSLQV